MPLTWCCCAAGGASATNRVSGYASFTALRCGRGNCAPAAANWIGCHAALVALAWSGYGLAGFRSASLESGALSGCAEKLDLLGRERPLVALRVCPAAMRGFCRRTLAGWTVPGYPALGAVRVAGESSDFNSGHVVLSSLISPLVTVPECAGGE